MQKHLGRLDGVANVEVSLLNGQVTIVPKVDARLDPARVLKRTYDGGVTVTEMTVTATGWVEKSAAGELELRIDGDRSFPVVAGALARELEPLAGTRRAVTVRGRLYQKPAGAEPAKPPDRFRLELIEIVKKG